MSRAPALPSRPSIRPERAWSRKIGGGFVAGIDEAGRGPLAGPVVAAAVVWDPEARRPTGINDSKRVSPIKREKLFGRIQRSALTWGIGVVHAEEIDLLNILNATRVAAQRALDEAAVRLEIACPGERIAGLVTDALDVPSAGLPTLGIIKGDRISVSIAAASILAKVYRDRLMDIYDREFPEYGWASNRGYPTIDHREAIERHGPCTLHRMTFAGVSFFTAERRQSRTGRRVTQLAETTPETADAVRSLLQLVTEAAECLPPPEFEILRERVDEQARRVGVELV